VADPRLKKQFGQHHLVSGSSCRPLVEYLEPAGKLVVEIGAGGGVLTRELVQAGAKVWSWEIDPEWAFTLQDRFDERGAAVVIGDALEIDWPRMPQGTRVAGNLPYGVATAIIQRLLLHHGAIDRAAFLVQLEVARRLVALPGDSDYGALSVTTRLLADATVLGRVKSGSFRPPPKVESAFIGLLPKTPALPASQVAEFVALVRLAFSQRRKTLRNSLASRWGSARADHAVQRLGLSRTARAETMDIEDFLELLQISREDGK